MKSVQPNSGFNLIIQLAIPCISLFGFSIIACGQGVADQRVAAAKATPGRTRQPLRNSCGLSAGGGDGGGQ